MTIKERYKELRFRIRQIKPLKLLWAVVALTIIMSTIIGPFLAVIFTGR